MILKRGFWMLTLLALTACAGGFDMPTNVAAGKAELHPGTHEITVDTASLNVAVLRNLAAHYKRSGHGPLELTVIYDQASKNNTASKAAANLDTITQILRKQGVRDVKGSAMPQKDYGETSRTRIAYGTLAAQGPAGCTPMKSYQDRSQVFADWDYQYGCTIEHLLAKQISKPSDLAGREGLPSGDGQRQGNIVDRYRSGEPNEALDAESASGTE